MLEFFNDSVHEFDIDIFQRGNSLRDLFDLVVGEVLHNFARDFFTQGYHDDSHFLHEGYRSFFFFVVYSGVCVALFVLGDRTPSLLYSWREADGTRPIWFPPKAVMSTSHM